MKKFYALFLTLLAAVAVGDIYAVESYQMQCSDTTLLAEWVDGNYLVRRYKIADDEDAQYTLKYSVSASMLNTLLAGNLSEIEDLDRMMADLKRDTTLRVQRIDITGYASPDGNAMSNEKLAMSRAEKFRSLIESRYALLSNYPIQVMADAEQWDNCNEAVLNSTIEDKQKVISIIDSPATESAKEHQLKQMPKVWSVFREQILPAMRRVEMVVYYNKDMIVEVRTLIERPQPKPQPMPQPATCPCRCVEVDETIGIIIDLTDPNGIY